MRGASAALITNCAKQHGDVYNTLLCVLACNRTHIKQGQQVRESTQQTFGLTRRPDDGSGSDLQRNKYLAVSARGHLLGG